MSKAIGNTLVWGLLYFFVVCGMRLALGNTHSFFEPAESVFGLAAGTAFAYFFGYRQGQKESGANAWIHALSWGVIYFFVVCGMRLVLGSTHSFFEPAETLFGESAGMAVAYFFGCQAGKKS